jgi:hypothetical protein
MTSILLHHLPPNHYPLVQRTTPVTSDAFLKFRMWNSKMCAPSRTHGPLWHTVPSRPGDPRCLQRHHFPMRQFGHVRKLQIAKKNSSLTHDAITPFRVQYKLINYFMANKPINSSTKKWAPCPPLDIVPIISSIELCSVDEVLLRIAPTSRRECQRVRSSKKRTGMHRSCCRWASLEE